MIGNRVQLLLHSPDQTVSGELRQQNAEGVWIYHGWAEQAKIRFYPIHRVIEIEDNGYVHR